MLKQFPSSITRKFSSKQKVYHPISVRGCRDILSNDARSRRELVDNLKNVVRLFGYNEIITPTIEHSDLFMRSLGSGSDIVMKEMYTFKDNSGKSVTLRPEGTVGVLRSIINAGMAYNLPHKLFYHGNMFRYERPQRGRFREFYQFGIEYIGCSSASSDLEVIQTASSSLKNLGIEENVTLQINTLGDMESRQKYRSSLEVYFSKYIDDLSPDSKLRLERGSVLRILDSKDKKDQAIIHDSPNFSTYLSTESMKRFEEVKTGLEKIKIDFTTNPRLVRGLDYYNHTAFEFVHSSDKQNDITVLAGGRYDGLSKQLGGPDIPAIGWAAGVDRLSLLAGSCTYQDLSIAVIPILVSGEEEYASEIKSYAMKIAQSLRHLGCITHVCHDDGGIKKHLKYANRINSRAAVIIGKEEYLSLTCMFKNLQNRKQHRIKESELQQTLEKLENNASSQV